jgi:hypothetical protein
MNDKKARRALPIVVASPLIKITEPLSGEGNLVVPTYKGYKQTQRPVKLIVYGLFFSIVSPERL